MSPFHRRKAVMAFVLCVLILAPVALIASRTSRKASEVPGPLGTSGATRLHNGWKITPAGTHHEELGDLLLGGILSPNGKWLAFVNGGGAAHQVHLADTTTGKVVSSVPLERAQSSGGILHDLLPTAHNGVDPGPAAHEPVRCRRHTALRFVHLPA